MTEPWNFCTHKHCDPSSGQQAGPCPLHDAVGYCQNCAQFLFDQQELKGHSKVNHYVNKIDRCELMAPLHYHHDITSGQKVPCTSEHPNYPGGYHWWDRRLNSMGLPCLPYDKQQAVRDTIQDKTFDMARMGTDLVIAQLLTWPLQIHGFFERWQFTIESN